MINATWQRFQFATLFFFSQKLIQLNKVTQSINEICNSTQLLKFLIKFYYKLFTFFPFGTTFFCQYNRFMEFTYVDVCIV